MLLSALRRQAASVVGRHNHQQHVASRLPAAHLMSIITGTGGGGPMASCDGDTAASNQPLSPPVSSGCIDGDAPAIGGGGGGHRYPHRGKAAGSTAIDGHTLRTTQPATTTATAAAGGSVWSAPPGHQQTVGILRHIIGQRMAMVRLRSVQFSTVATDLQPTPSTPTQQSSLAEVEQWLRWFLSENTKLSPERQTELVNKLACSGKTLLSRTKEDLLRRSPDFGDDVYNALRQVATTASEIQWRLARAYKTKRTLVYDAAKVELPLRQPAFVGREAQIASLCKWADTRAASILGGRLLLDRTNCHVPLNIGCSGIGKTRFSVEALNLIEQQVSATDHSGCQSLQTLLRGAKQRLSLLVSLGNGTPYDSESQQSVETAVSFRLLAAYFSIGVPEFEIWAASNLPNEVALATAIEVIRIDLQLKPSDMLVLHLTIDEVQKALLNKAPSPEQARAKLSPFVASIGHYLQNQSTAHKVFLIPILTGISYEPVRQLGSEVSTYPIIDLTPPLLSLSEAVQVVDNAVASATKTAEVLTTIANREKLVRYIAFLGGHARATTVFADHIASGDSCEAALQPAIHWGYPPARQPSTAEWGALCRHSLGFETFKPDDTINGREDGTQWKDAVERFTIVAPELRDDTYSLRTPPFFLRYWATRADVPFLKVLFNGPMLSWSPFETLVAWYLRYRQWDLIASPGADARQPSPPSLPQPPIETSLFDLLFARGSSTTTGPAFLRDLRITLPTDLPVAEELKTLAYRFPKADSNADIALNVVHINAPMAPAGDVVLIAPLAASSRVDGLPKFNWDQEAPSRVPDNAKMILILGCKHTTDQTELSFSQVRAEWIKKLSAFVLPSAGHRTSTKEKKERASWSNNVAKRVKGKQIAAKDEQVADEQLVKTARSQTLEEYVGSLECRCISYPFVVVTVLVSNRLLGSKCTQSLPGLMVVHQVKNPDATNATSNCNAKGTYVPVHRFFPHPIKVQLDAAALATAATVEATPAEHHGASAKVEAEAERRNE